MKLKQTLSHYQKHLKNIPRRYWIIGGVFAVIIVYSLVFFIPRQVYFSYAGETCIKQLLLAPALQSAQTDDFTLTTHDELKIGSLALASTRLCIQPTHAPAEGVHTASIAPFGGMVAAKQFRITIPEAPKAEVAALQDAAISIVQPLEVPLSASDKIHTYSLAIHNEESACQERDARLFCDVAALQLSPAATYTMSLMRYFNGASEKTLATEEITTLPSLVITGTSITDGQVVYAKPTEVTLTADREVQSIEATLKRIDGNDVREVSSKSVIEGKVAMVRFLEALPRNSKYELTVRQMIGEDGSSLAKPHTTQFTTSGGPAVKTISVGAHSVDRNARIIITLDQPLAETVDVAHFVEVEGADASVSKVTHDQLAVVLRSAPDCAAFTVTLKKGMQSGVNDELSAEWRHASRTVCGTSSVIGYSVQGRPITAYYFGSGDETVLFTGGIHGSERSGQQTMQAWVEYLRAYGNTIPANRRVVVVPNTNPDAIALNKRYNVNNVNIDRNFPASNWQANIETAQGLIVNGGGTAPASEPETKALLALTRQLRPRLSVSFHAQGRLVGANQVSISVDAGSIYASTVGYKTMYGMAEEVMGYPITGEYEDWMGEELGVAAILIELPTPNGSYLDSQLTAIKKMLQV